ncbi:SpoIID/LytB domain [Thermosinus carboxydivorans Nor1]|uniref:SpoIID/LytB domain n=1 Tax=Thermosinus carboxydivorans Nor1 TaxID=401526 RepID=A1HRT5_9FIRM|nr:SpoIID/LytB domain-containing protein [Thermosinus carboxydivorans]EAX47256.1 SpoIID/LytB domain [Thermosinus carboxydivorans Nor1]
MSKTWKQWFWLPTFLLAVVLVLGGCNLFKPPQPKPQPAPPGPPPQKQAVQGAEPDILVYMHETGEKKTMKMEDYIAGVVAGEMKNDWPVEALAAQAIIARTFTVEAIETKGGVPARGTQASTDIKEFQAYNAAAVNDRVKQAVQMTRGMIITYQGKPAKTWFHASAGGVTATAKEGLDYKEPEPPYIQSVQSPDDLAPPEVQNWTATFSKQDVMAALAKAGQRVDRIDSFEIGQKGPSGRTTVFVVNKNVQVSGPALRVALDSTKLKSLLLDKVEVSGDSITFIGKGYGHGVGMSQWGAHKLAQDGKKPEEIIGHYYRGITIEKRWQ